MRRFGLLFYFLLLSLVIFSQEITVRKFGQATQFIAAADKLKDYDGDPCAVIKIQGAKIDSVSGAFEVRKMGAEFWAYMTNGDRRLTIYKQGYEPKTVIFSEYGFVDVKSDKVYLMTIYAPELTRQSFILGVYAGGNFTTSGLKDDYIGSADWVVGFNVGVSAAYMFTDMIGASVGLFIANKGYKYTNETLRNPIIDEKGDFHFLDIPVQALFNFKLSDAVNLQMLAGPCFSLNIGGKATCHNPYYNEKFSNVYSVFQMGGQVGIRFVFSKHYAVGADYQFGFSDYKCQDIGFNIGYVF